MSATNTNAPSKKFELAANLIGWGSFALIGVWMVVAAMNVL